MPLRTAAVAVVLVVSEIAAFRINFSGSVIELIAALLLLVASALLVRDPEQRGNAFLLDAAVVAIVVTGVDGSVGPAANELGFLTTWWPLVPLAWFFLRYPGSTLSRRARWIVGILAGCVGPGWAVAALLWDPERAGYREPNHWWTIGDWEPVRYEVQFWVATTMVLVLLAGAVVLLARWHTAVGLARLAVRWVCAAGAVLAATVAVTLAMQWLAPRFWHVGDHDYGQWRLVAVGLVTVAVLGEALRRRAAAVGVVDDLLRLGADGAGLTGVLRRAFADPHLTLGEEPHAAAGRVALPVTASDGRVVAYVDTDASALRDPAWTRTVLGTAAVVLENAALHRSVLDSLEDVRTSRTRLVEAGLAERRRVERDLHDGAQQYLLAAASSLGRLELAADDEHARGAALADAKAQLGTALTELRRLARGIYPPVLTQAGLAAALRTLGDSAPVTVDVAEIDGRRFDPGVESTAWFVACEAVANAVRHAGPASIELATRVRTGELEIDVRDDGAGGADAGGSGLAGLADRVHALGGTFRVDSPPGHGTRVTVRLPVT